MARASWNAKVQRQKKMSAEFNEVASDLFEGDLGENQPLEDL
jgi:hypothetical protein